MNNIIWKLKQKRLKRKYEKAKSLYVVGCWVDYGIMEAKFSGKYNKEGHPLVIEWNDHNGMYESYHVAPWYTITTGHTYLWTFNKSVADKYVKILREVDKCNLRNILT